MSKTEKVGLITGITGQDGSYLAELLLAKDYFVWGLIRRSSEINTQRINHLYKNKKLILRYGDLSDSANLLHILADIKESYPDLGRLEVYNLGAMSHVKVSFEMPEYTANIDGTGTLRLLEAIRANRLERITRFYQASTSEMYGKVQEVPQSETTPFYPRSPYGVAKLYSYWITKNYRESYGMFCSNGILFNHETLAGFMPLIFRQDGQIDIKPISEIVRYHTCKIGTIVDEKKNCYQEGFVERDLEVWDKGGWTKVTFASGYPHDKEKDNKHPRFIVSKGAAYFTTNNHVIIMDNNDELKAKDIKIDQKVKLIEYPVIEKDLQLLPQFDDGETDITKSKVKCPFCNYIFARKSNLNHHLPKCSEKNLVLSREINELEAEFLGLMVGDGCVSGSPKFTNKSLENIEYVKKIWSEVCSQNNKEASTVIQEGKSGFTGGKIYQINLHGFCDFFRKYQIYNVDKTKRIPKQVLNGNQNIKLKFLEGYNMADGLKQNKCVYMFKNFKTNSATLAQGLIFLIDHTTKQNFNINVEFVHKFGSQRMYYSINLLSNSRFSKGKGEEKRQIVRELHLEGNSMREISRKTNISRKFISQILNSNYQPVPKDPKSKDSNTVKKIIDYSGYDGWFYDLTTESGTFHAGIGKGVIHNSPRRGPTFVTRKITKGLGMILNGERDRLVMGNLDAKRDWGHAKDFVYGMWLILQHDKPDDFVLATNEYHTVREFIEKAFALKGFDISWKGEGVEEIGYDKTTGRELIAISDRYFRPAEVDELLGDPTKAKKELGWEPTTSFDQLIKEMIDNDCQAK